MATSPQELARARSELGYRAETLACEHLEQQGFEIVERNARVGHLELDVIARSGRLLVFCEVRARVSDLVMTPAQSITPKKVRRIRRAAVLWLKRSTLRGMSVRFDVASVLFDVPDGRLNYLEGAF